MTDRDRELLEFLARHRLVQARHVAALLQVAHARAGAILARLARGGYVERQRVFEQQPSCWRIGRKGLDVIGSSLPAPGLDLRAYEHDVGVAWLWLAARDGAFGSVREILAERQLRSHDEAPHREGRPLAVRLGGVGRGGRERLHYPDLLVVLSDGRRIAVELELTTKARPRLEGILAGYGADPRADAVLYLAKNRTIGNAVLAAARRVGVAHVVHVQLARDESAVARGGAVRALERARSGSRAPARESRATERHS